MDYKKDQPSRWTKYTAGMCAGCIGTCCTMPVEVKAEDLVRLGIADEIEIHTSPKRVAKKLIKDGILQSYREATGNFMLTQKANDDCYFLDSKTRLCTVYEKRPGVCREFPSIGPRPGYCPVQKK